MPTDADRFRMSDPSRRGGRCLNRRKPQRWHLSVRRRAKCGARRHLLGRRRRCRIPRRIVFGPRWELARFQTLRGWVEVAVLPVMEDRFRVCVPRSYLT